MRDVECSVAPISSRVSGIVSNRFSDGGRVKSVGTVDEFGMRGLYNRGFTPRPKLDPSIESHQPRRWQPPFFAALLLIWRLTDRLCRLGKFGTVVQRLATEVREPPDWRAHGSIPVGP